VNFAALLSLVAVVGLLMGCSEAPRRTALTEHCFVEETKITVPTLWCGTKIMTSIPASELVTR
jgi:hypothetical protein